MIEVMKGGSNNLQSGIFWHHMEYMFSLNYFIAGRIIKTWWENITRINVSVIYQALALE